MSFCQKFLIEYGFLPQDLRTRIKALAGALSTENECIAMSDGKPRMAKRVIQMLLLD